MDLVRLRRGRGGPHHLSGWQQFAIKKSLGQPLPALLFNYVIGIVGVAIYTIARRVSVPSLEQATQVPWWGWLGGAFGAVYGLAAILLASNGSRDADRACRDGPVGVLRRSRSFWVAQF